MSRDAATVAGSFDPRLREEATTRGSRSFSTRTVSIHASVKRRPHRAGHASRHRGVSIHASVKRRRLAGRVGLQVAAFRSTPP